MEVQPGEQWQDSDSCSKTGWIPLWSIIYPTDCFSWICCCCRPTPLHQASPSLQPAGCGSKDGSSFWLHGVHTAPIQLCTAVMTEHNTAPCCFIPTPLLTLISFPSQERKLGCQWRFTNAAARLPSLGFYQWGQPRAHGGCWFGWRAAWNRAGVLHMVCHS